MKAQKIWRIADIISTTIILILVCVGTKIFFFTDFKSESENPAPTQGNFEKNGDASATRSIKDLPMHDECDGLDNDGDGLIDEYPQNTGFIFYKDEDEDGFGEESSIIRLCEPMYPFTTHIGGDCNDKNQNICPDAMDICWNRVDEDCDGKDKRCPPYTDTAMR